MNCTSAKHRMANLSLPPPPASMKVRVDLKCLIFTRIMFLWCELHDRSEFRLLKKFVDALENVPIEDIKCFTTDYNLLPFELTLTWEAVNQMVELVGGHVQQSKRLAELMILLSAAQTSLCQDGLPHQF